MILRDYQQEAYDCVLSEFDRSDCTLCVLFTGSGKTVIFSHIIKHFLQFGRIMVLAHREELILQAKDKIKKITGKDSDIEMSEQWSSNRGFFKAEIVVSTIQTQIAGREGGRMTRFDPNEFSLLIIDEAHHAPADTYKKVIAYYRQNPKLKVLGVTATPDRSDKEAMGQIFQSVAYEYDIKDGIDDGWLTPIQQQSVYVAGLDYSQVKTTAGDLNGKDLAEVLEFEENLHGIADPTVQLAGDKKTLVFAASVAHAERLTEIFNRHKSGSANFVCATTPKEYRREIIQDFANGGFQFLVNVGIFTEGFDEPSIINCVLARPTKSRSLYCQMVGRTTRVLTETNIDQYDTVEARRDAIFNSAKPFATVIDFVGNAGRHKLICPADILGGNYPDEVIELAKKNAAEKSNASKKPVDIASELQQAEREIAHRARMREDAEARNHLLLRAKFSTAKVNPFDVLDVDPVRVAPWHKDKPPTQGQKAYLDKAGVDTSGMDFTHASQIISQLIKNREQGKPSYKQIKVLAKRGLDCSNMTFQEAGKFMTELVSHNWVTPARWKDLKKETVPADDYKGEF